MKGNSIKLIVRKRYLIGKSDGRKEENDRNDNIY